MQRQLNSRAEEKEQQIIELQKKLDAAQSAVKTLESVSTGSADDLHAQIVKLTKELAEERAKQASLVPVDKLSEAKAQLVSKQDEIQKALDEAKKAQEEAQKAKQDAKAALSTNKDLQAQIQKLEQQKAELAKAGGSKACSLL